MINLDQMPSAPIDFDKMQDANLGGGQSARDLEIRRRLLDQVSDNKKLIDEKYGNNKSQKALRTHGKS